MVFLLDQRPIKLNITKKIQNTLQVKKRKKADSKIITNLNVDGKQITNQSEIRTAQKNYYENLYDRKKHSKSFNKLF